MLVHHADAELDGVHGGVELGLLAIHPDLALGGLVQAVEDVHQCGFPRAVFADQGMDLALPHAEIDVPVGDDPREAHGDMPHIDGKLHRDLLLLWIESSCVCGAAWHRGCLRLLRSGARRFAAALLRMRACLLGILYNLTEIIAALFWKNYVS